MCLAPSDSFDAPPTATAPHRGEISLEEAEELLKAGTHGVTSSQAGRVGVSPVPEGKVITFPGVSNAHFVATSIAGRVHHASGNPADKAAVKILRGPTPRSGTAC